MPHSTLTIVEVEINRRLQRLRDLANLIDTITDPANDNSIVDDVVRRTSAERHDVQHALLLHKAQQ